MDYSDLALKKKFLGLGKNPHKVYAGQCFYWWLLYMQIVHLTTVAVQYALKKEKNQPAV